VNRT